MVPESPSPQSEPVLGVGGAGIAGRVGGGAIVAPFQAKPGCGPVCMSRAARRRLRHLGLGLHLLGPRGRPGASAAGPGRLAWRPRRRFGCGPGSTGAPAQRVPNRGRPGLAAVRLRAAAEGIRSSGSRQRAASCCTCGRRAGGSDCMPSSTPMPSGRRAGHLCGQGRLGPRTGRTRLPGGGPDAPRRGATRIRLLTNNTDKAAQMAAYGIAVAQ